MQKILIADDDKHIAELITLYLKKEGYETLEVYSGTDTVSAFAKFAPHLVLLDLMLPGKDGYQVCREIRQTSATPVIMLTAKGETFDKVVGLELGADDYIVKPFDAKELVARIKAVLRRFEAAGQDAGDIVALPDLTIDQSTRTVTYRGREVFFPPKEFELLFFLAARPNKVFTRDQLLDKIWGYEFSGDTRTVDVHIKRIREKLPDGDEWGFKTVWGVGYKLELK